jgi:hypothetical protein
MIVDRERLRLYLKNGGVEAYAVEKGIAPTRYLGTFVPK